MKWLNPVWRKARSIVKLVTGNPAIQDALKELSDLILTTLLEAVLYEALRRRVNINPDIARQAARLIQEAKP